MLHILPVISHHSVSFSLSQFLIDLEVPVDLEAEGTDGTSTYYYLKRP